VVIRNSDIEVELRLHAGPDHPVPAALASTTPCWRSGASTSTSTAAPGSPGSGRQQPAPRPAGVQEQRHRRQLQHPDRPVPAGSSQHHVLPVFRSIDIDVNCSTLIARFLPATASTTSWW